MQQLEVIYRLTASDDIDERIESILLEQSIETPRSVAERYPFVREHMLGSVRQVATDELGRVSATLALPFLTASIDPSQFLNVLFGNSSLHDDVELIDFTPPPEVTDLLPGPRHGIEGIRRRLGVHDRPLTCSALKPVGMTIDEMSEVCGALARGGIDLIKDDHYLADHPFAPFEDRVTRFQDVVQEAAAATGRTSLYVPNLSGTPDTVRRQAERAQEAGVGAVMMAPMLLGLPAFHEIVRTDLDVPALAHPSFGGVRSIRPSTAYGKLFRLYGADAVIFANFGGRFSFSPDICRDIAERLRSDWLGIRPSFPVPAGGMDADRAGELISFFGHDVILLVGGSLLMAGDALEDTASTFAESVRAAAAMKNDDADATR